MRLTWNAALEETEMVLFESVHKLFKATGVSAQDVSFLFVHLSSAPPPAGNVKGSVILVIQSTSSDLHLSSIKA